MSYKDRITIEPGKRGGKPCIRGLRITVYDILSYLASGMSYEEILADFPYLTREDILASLEFAALRSQTGNHDHEQGLGLQRAQCNPRLSAQGGQDTSRKLLYD